MNFFTRRNGQIEPTMTYDEPTFPHFSGLPMTPDPRQRRISEAAAGAAQYVIDLEGEVSRLKEALAFECNSNSLVSEANKILHEQIAALEQENRKLRESNARVRTKLQVSGSIVLEAMREAESWEQPAPAMTEQERAEREETEAA